ncbi:hypothetical protein [Enterovirga aerilata]|uniref:Twin-arginine translocation signal domain-containing protein n=1 Tax=Enterovirga aerilata TaxID=2730920 RepID=A0A849IGI9_9HYPH|nr:hypothetical protein [Enterovirga sp. DB1703]NNM75067.1 hypothetical protein [Enterovirga sp. DB1703]
MMVESRRRFLRALALAPLAPVAALAATRPADATSAEKVTIEVDAGTFTHEIEEAVRGFEERLQAALDAHDRDLRRTLGERFAAWNARNA